MLFISMMKLQSAKHAHIATAAWLVGNAIELWTNELKR